MSEHPEHHAVIGSPPINLALVLLLGVLGLYLGATRRRRRSMRPWSGWRSACFAAGIAVLALALSPPLAALAHHDFRGHVVQHLLIGMLAPLGLVLGAPITLLLRVVPAAAGRRVVGLLRSRPLRWLTHPLTALLLSVGGMYLLYLTPLYPAMQTHPPLHQLVNFHFLASGVLFTAAMVGPDPVPHRPSLRARRPSSSSRSPPPARASARRRPSRSPSGCSPSTRPASPRSAPWHCSPRTRSRPRRRGRRSWAARG